MLNRRIQLDKRLRGGREFAPGEPCYSAKSPCFASASSSSLALSTFG